MCPKRAQVYGQKTKRGCNTKKQARHREYYVISSVFGASPIVPLDHSRMIAGSGESCLHRKSFQQLRGLLPREKLAPVPVSKDKRLELHRGGQSDRGQGSIRQPFARSA